MFYSPYGVVGENSTSYMLLVSELANSVTSFRVSYPAAGGLAFEQVYNVSSFGPDLAVPINTTAAELEISVRLFIDFLPL